MTAVRVYHPVFSIATRQKSCQGYTPTPVFAQHFMRTLKVCCAKTGVEVYFLDGKAPSDRPLELLVLDGVS